VNEQALGLQQPVERGGYPMQDRQYRGRGLRVESANEEDRYGGGRNGNGLLGGQQWQQRGGHGVFPANPAKAGEGRRGCDDLGNLIGC
jgi:hypothetical protein